MRRLTRLVPFVVFACVFAATQDAVTVERKWVADEVDKHRIGMAMSTQVGDVTITMTSTQKVAKVYDNGDADMEFKTSDVSVLLDGTEMPVPDAIREQQVSMRFNKLGLPVEKPQSGRTNVGYGLILYANVVAASTIKLGGAAEIDFSPQERPKSRIKGTTTFESVKEGVAKLIGKYDIWSEEAGDKPMKMTMTHWMRVADGKFVKSEGTFSDLPNQQGIEIAAIQYTMELIEK